MKKYDKLILIVEDEDSIRKVLTIGLEKAGFNTASVENGQEALDLVKEKNPDLILLDVIMPIMDGITFLEKLRKQQVYRRLPVIVLTNLKEVMPFNYAVAKGVKDYLVKSDWSMQDLVAKIKLRLNIK